MGMSFALKLIMERGKADQVETTSQVREATTVSSVLLKLLFVTFRLVSPIYLHPKVWLILNTN